MLNWGNKLVVRLTSPRPITLIVYRMFEGNAFPVDGRLVKTIQPMTSHLLVVRQLSTISLCISSSVGNPFMAVNMNMSVFTRTHIHAHTHSPYTMFCIIHDAFPVNVYLFFNCVFVVDNDSYSDSYLCWTILSKSCTFLNVSIFIVGIFYFCMQSDNILFLYMLARIRYGEQTQLRDNLLRLCIAV